MPARSFRRRVDELDASAVSVTCELIAELSVPNPELAGTIVVQVLEGLVVAQFRPTGLQA